MQNLLKSGHCFTISWSRLVKQDCVTECWRLVCQFDDIDLQLLRAGRISITDQFNAGSGFKNVALSA